MQYRRLHAVVIATLTVSVTGCAEFRSPTSWFGDKPMQSETVRNPVHRIVTVWQATDGPGLDNLPGRGFAGQILFFPNKGEAPVKIEGDVRIYVFDDQGPEEEQTKPIHQFDFPEGSLNKQLVAGSLGPTYQLFIPYTRKGPQQAHCSLRMRYTPKVGRTVYSEVVSVNLPGSKSERGDAVVSQPRRSVPRVSNGDDVETFRLDHAQDVAHRPDLTEALRRSTTGESSRVDDRGRTSPERSEVERAQADRIAQLERRLAERENAVASTSEDDFEEDPRRQSFVDRSERSTPVRQAGFDLDEPRFRPLEISRPTPTMRDFGREAASPVPHNGGRHPFSHAEIPGEGTGHIMDERPLAPSIAASRGATDDRRPLDTRSTATSGASTQQRFRLTGRPATEREAGVRQNDRFGNLGVSTGHSSNDSPEWDRRFSLDSAAWTGENDDAGSREIR